jgi:hypothetical protein
MPTREHAPHLQTLDAHLHAMRDEFPLIRPEREDDDLEWFNEGSNLLAAGRLNQAERVFKKLTLAQPSHPDGPHGLAMVYRQRNFLAWTRLFIDEAIRRAQAFVQDGSMDLEAFREYTDFRDALGHVR